MSRSCVFRPGYQPRASSNAPSASPDAGLDEVRSDERPDVDLRPALLLLGLHHEALPHAPGGTQGHHEAPDGYL